MSDSFVHLHVHTEYSMLDGASRIGELVEKAHKNGQPALGITDHGNMYGIIDFYKTCKAGGIKPILGIEAYMANDKVSERPARRGRLDDSGGSTKEGKKLYYHLTLLAKNEIGYKNLIQLSSRSFLEGYYYKPRVDWDILSDHSEGLIATTGCLGSQVNQALLNNDYEEGLNRASRLRDIFGQENLYAELQDHGIAEQKKTLGDLMKIAKTLDIPTLATNDCHYTERSHSHAHDALLCIQTAKLISDEDRFKFEGEEHYLKTAEEMRELFRENKEACDSTLAIAEKCNVEIEFGEPKLPHYEPLPPDVTSEDKFLELLVMEGARKRWGAGLKDSTVDRLVYELKTISEMGFSSYFLIIWDLVKYAKSQKIRVGPGRGSAAGCAVAYCLEITELDPVKYNLLFERFLNPARRQMPDIDLDFDSRYRDELIRYLSQKYGRDHVAQIITFSKLKARAAVRDSARVLGHPYSLGDKLIKVMPPPVMGRSTPLAACLKEDEKYKDGYVKSAELREMYKSDPAAKEIIDVAIELENLCRQDSVHAAAVVLSKEALTEYLPIQRKPPDKGDIEDAPIVTQYEMHAVEALGLLKMDLLGLRNLDVISETLEIIELTTDEKIIIEDVSLEDQKTYELLQRAETMGVFQLESETMRSLMTALVPDCLDDVAALVALHRPGPMEANMHIDYADRKNQRKSVDYIHKDATEILSETHGLMIYQESMMLIAQKFAGFTAGEAEDLRKACGKKIRSIMVEQKEKFIQGCERTMAEGSDKPYGKKIGEQWWKLIEPFADYAFNKSHSYGYSLIAYQTAYLKANYPVQFMAALLNSVKGNADRAGVYLSECRRMELKVMVPNINISVANFITSGNKIPFGLTAIRNVGSKVVELIVDERNQNGDFVDFFDFCERVPQTVLNKKTVESLILAGAFDSLGHPRKALMDKFEEIAEIALSIRTETAAGSVSMFEDAGLEKSVREIIQVGEEEYFREEKLALEKSMLGWYVSDHPLAEIADKVRESSDCTLREFETMKNESSRKLCGVITQLKPKQTRKGQAMATFVLEDLEHQIEALVFPQVWQKLQYVIKSDMVMLVKARLNVEDESTSIFIEDARPLDERVLYDIEAPENDIFENNDTKAETTFDEKNYDNSIPASGANLELGAGKELAQRIGDYASSSVAKTAASNGYDSNGQISKADESSNLVASDIEPGVHSNDKGNEKKKIPQEHNSQDNKNLIDESERTIENLGGAIQRLEKFKFL